jgi:hypothetical protein
MPPRLDSADRRLLIAAAVLFVALVAGLSFFATGDSDLEMPSSYSTASGGARAAYLLLQSSGYRTARWERPLDELPAGDRTTLILAEPGGLPDLQQRKRLSEFVSSGGRLIVTGGNVLYVPGQRLELEPVPVAGWRRATAVSPSAITRAAPEITLVASFTNTGTASSITPLYSESNRVAVARYMLGDGEVIWWASATPLTNAGITRPGNLEFFLACVGQPGGSSVLWDEYVHGYRSSIAASTSHSPTGWLFLQLAILALAVLFTFARRSGPILSPAGETRLSPLEFVQTLGGLYERARVSSVAVDVCYRRLLYNLARRLGVPRDSPPEAFARALRERWNFDDPALLATLESARSAAVDSRLKPKDALRIVRALCHINGVGTDFEKQGRRMTRS